MTPEQFDKILAMIDQAAKSGGILAGQLFQFAVYKAIADGFGFLLAAVVLFILEIVLFSKFNSASRTYWALKSSTDEQDFLEVMRIILQVIVCLLFVVMGWNAILHLVAPQWYAISSLVELVK
jgi:hypothetical protein